MDVIDVKLLVKLCCTDKLIQITITTSLFIIVLFSAFIGIVHSLSLLCLLCCGFLTFHHVFRYKSKLDNLLHLFINNEERTRNVTKEDSIDSVSCTVCGKSTCDRGATMHNSKPWSDLQVPEEIDIAVTNLLNKTLDEFLLSWYKDFSSDNSFPQEIKEAVRYALSVVVARSLKVDLAKLLTDKVLGAMVIHAQCFHNLMEGNEFPMHPAMKSRDSELMYLRSLVTNLMPFIVPHNESRCKNFEILIREVLAGWLFLPLADTVSDPAVLNSLLILNLGRQLLTNYSQSREETKVEFLAQFVSNGKNATEVISALQPEMSTILKDQNLLYAFMQFLKNQGAVHILQFCLDVEEFNRRMLIPELSSDELDLLYRDAWDLYSLYFSPHSPDSIDFAPSLVTQMRKVLSKDVTKLRTSPPLFQAYEYAYGLLDTIYCPKFHNSDDFYTWLCGPRIPCNTNNSGASFRNDQRRQESNKGVSKLSSRLHKIKGALKAQPVLEGQTYDIDMPLDLETDTEFAEALQFESETERDLSAWRVSIPSLTSHIDPSTNKISMFFNITVKRIDVTQGDSSEWNVERRLADFYSLDAKLTEFHGEFTDTQLPPRRLLSSSGSRSETTQIYEEYLQKLLSKPSLRGSDLLFAFLACPGDFVAEDNTLGRLLRRSVPITLRKERGQNLEPFIATFVASTESKVKNSKIEFKDMSQEMSPRHIRNIKSDVFGNNFGIAEGASSWNQKVPLNSPMQCLIYCGSHLFSWPVTIMRLLLAVQSFIGNTLDAFLHYWLDLKLRYLLVPQRIAHLINLLQWAIFESKSKRDRIQIAKHLETLLQERGKWSKTLELRVYSAIYISLQYPPLNKQLFYCLLDTVIAELFPEIQNNEESST